jgi:hypothetical protein
VSDGIDSHDVYLVLHPFRGNVREFGILVRPLADLDQRYLAGAEGFYAPEIDTALVVLRFTRRAYHRLGDRHVELFVGRSGLPMVVPERLNAEARRRFFLEHLSGYSTYVQLYPSSDQVGLAERVLINLTDHIVDPGAPRTDQELCFDIEAELPVINPRRPRLSSESERR